MTTFVRLLLSVLLAATAAFSWSPCVRADDDGRQDNRMGNPDRTRSGVNENGDNEMVIERKPKRQQQVPDMGGIVVVPQVNGRRGGTTTVVPVPVPSQQGAGNRQQSQP